jgi:hypothetical protein
VKCFEYKKGDVMTLADALKTKRDYRQAGKNGYLTFGCTYYYTTSELTADNWEVEPAVYEVECEMVDRQGFLSIGEILKTSQQGIYNKLVGKHVKATFEVID